MGIINYIKTIWADRSVQYPTRYTATKVGGGALSSGDDITLTPSAGTITTAGTQVTASRLNNLEEAVEDLDVAVGSTWINLGTTTLTGSALAIPTGYKHLQIIIEDILITSPITQGIYFNGDTTDGNYSWRYIGTSATRDSSSPYISTGQFANTDNYYAIIDIINNTDKLKFVSFSSHIDNSGTGFDGNGLYKVTTEISSMSMTQFDSGRATIYGIK